MSNASPEPVRLLLVDDDRKLCRLIADYLEPLGYAVECVHDGAEGLERAREGDFRAVLLDVMLPTMDGFEVLKRLREVSAVPVLMLTAMGEEVDRVVGLEMGADDYLPKTFSTREMLARIRAVTRRERPTPASGATAAAPDEEWSVSGLHVSEVSHTAVLDDKLLELTPVEFALLVALIRAKGRVKSREQLVEEVADRNFEAFDRSVDVHVSALRRKLGDDAKDPRFIRTVRGTGYVFIDPARDPFRRSG